MDLGAATHVSFLLVSASAIIDDDEEIGWKGLVR